ncbi:MAG: hypothetical protein JW867_00120 [Candidatus Omnitrophica bacterium]|nr:hypothetical protein [Candidatus Omnitrophota bacterium]
MKKKLLNNFKNKINPSFTLLEVILAVAISSIILLTLYNSFNLGSGLYTQLSRDVNAQAQEILETISSNLRSAYILPDPDSKLFFTAGKSALRFNALESLSKDLSDRQAQHMNKVGFFLKAGKKKGFTFVYQKESKPRELSNDIDDLSFAFFDGKSWVDSWSSNQELPLAVSIKLGFKDTRRPEKKIVYSTVVDLPAGGKKTE